MACLPYPTFLRSPTRTACTQSLSAVGRVRIHPLTCPGRSSSNVDEGIEQQSTKSTTSEAGDADAKEEYQAIVSKCIQQSKVDDTADNKDNAKLRKKLMMEGVALASSYLVQTLAIDVSIIDVEIVLSAESIIETDGCLASCFLDAGCAYVVIQAEGQEEDEDRAKALEACYATRVPKERLVLHMKEGQITGGKSMMDDIVSCAGTISVHMTWNNNAEEVPISTRVAAMVSKEWKCVVQLSINETATKTSNEDLIETVASISKAIGENGGYITLVDPTAEQLGLCYAACMKTDRPDGLYTTVVCTRSNEALGLVYSSKVRDVYQ